ncbi:MAG TPA: AarF/ABC1/UbiB kinase family protein [Acidimicrobiia bacterium]|nr:AarF/ABC1/UbiB kinase family protein [Acidimicrobiia bacterium]
MSAVQAGALRSTSSESTHAASTRWWRAARLGRLAARRTSGYMVMRSQQLVHRGQSRPTIAERYQVRSAQDIAREFGEMRGAMVKLGQLLSVAAIGLPDDARAALTSLQSHVPPMAPGLAERIVREDLGSDVVQIFREWDPTPVAAASIGQVHRARMLDGTAVAVKVQYPGLDECLGADLRNVGRIARVFSGLAFPGVDTTLLIDEMRSALLDELDYRGEAQRQVEFANRWAGSAGVRVPRVFLEHSSRRVLVTEWVDGHDLASFARAGSPAARRTAAETLLAFSFDSVFRFGSFHADPHPGNVRFSDDGVVTVLDYGLVRRLTNDERGRFLRLLDALLDGDDASVFRTAREAGLLPNDCASSPAAVAAFLREPFALFAPGERRCREEWLLHVARTTFDPHGPHAAVLAEIEVPPSYFFVDRVMWGVMATLAQLHVPANWRALIDARRRACSDVTSITNPAPEGV